MLAETASAPFSRPGWLFELKYDGWRLLAWSGPGGPVLRLRGGGDVTSAHPAVARALASLGPAPLLLDGELVVLDSQGRPDFHALQRGEPATFVAFDLLAAGGFDLRRRPLLQRKELLRGLLSPSPAAIRFADHLEEHGEALFEEVSAQGIEGVMAKRADSPYRAGRSDDWLKLCVDRRADLVVVGYLKPDPPRRGLSSLHLAGYAGGRLVYAGRAGSGIDEELASKLVPALESRRLAAPPCVFPPGIPPPRGELTVWTRPELACEVRIKGWTTSGAVRQPVFLRLRVDKPLADCLLPARAGPPGR